MVCKMCILLRGWIRGCIGLTSVARKSEGWRKERDSNSRMVLPITRFPSVRLKPLGHPSINYKCPFKPEAILP